MRFWLASMATWQSSRAMSICWPSPLRLRSCSAARMPTVEYMPVIRSVTATPAFCGPPPGRSSRSPVMLIRPPMPWIMKS
ncbi:Uncharacterised protein [Bordetella pertussis]|nr:Uncharacterised protein [Bordetella pertussis]CFP58862.1 Uncharacterised protein [Bordetella pertussis]CFW36767.1 Uncharacterised protein [Bordetella pertussis]